MTTLNEILAAVQERLEVVRAAKDEYDRLERALAALGGPAYSVKQPRKYTREEVLGDPEAPYGRKRDGTPAKRRGRPRKLTTAVSLPPETAKLNITTGGVPAVKDGAEPRYVTQES